MRIGLFSDTYLPINNGISYVVELTRSGLEALGHEVYIFAPSPDSDYVEDDGHIIRYRAIKGATYEDDLTSVFFPPLQLQKINKLKLDVIHFFTPNQVGLLGLMAGLKYDVPVIAQYSTDIYQYVDYYPAAEKVILAFPIAAPIVLKGRLKSWGRAFREIPEDRRMKTWIKRLTAEYLTSMHDKCDAVIVLSKKHQAQLLEWNTQSDLRLMPTGVDPLPVPTAKEIQAFKKKYGILKNEKVILYAGRISKEKNLDLLLEAYASFIAPHHENTKLLFAGDFDYREELEQKARATGLGERIIFTGHFQRQKLGVVYASADIFAFPSLTDTQGLVLHEAAGAGLPMVMCDAHVSEIFHNNSNGLLAANEPEDFAEKIMEILSDTETTRSMGKKSKEYATEHTEEKQIKDLEALYTRCIKNHKKIQFAGGEW